ncbi:hypothetical protein [Cellulomonas xiejunii]|uniref:hypothetical protein n=1 Tax=Cellulomonas xiejunii TaxID=2968083 RepID=UPI001D0E74A9|nr:hypothetical protein [Cellulomonas xiejunii]MCC2316264.1 hypothetical protein [Cellulomonas xiejunii]
MTERSFDTSGLTRAASDTFTVRRVFGEPYERDGLLVVPVARVAGVTGSGAGNDERSSSDGGGGGFAAHVRPLGVFELGDDGARWHPAVDVNRAILGGQIAATIVASVWALAWAVRRR